jgi:hypothetical protein
MVISSAVTVTGEDIDVGSTAAGAKRGNPVAVANREDETHKQRMVAAEALRLLMMPKEATTEAEKNSSEGAETKKTLPLKTGGKEKELSEATNAQSRTQSEPGVKTKSKATATHNKTTEKLLLKYKPSQRLRSVNDIMKGEVVSVSMSTFDNTEGVDEPSELLPSSFYSSSTSSSFSAAGHGDEEKEGIVSNSEKKERSEDQNLWSLMEIPTAAGGKQSIRSHKGPPGSLPPCISALLFAHPPIPQKKGGAGPLKNADLSNSEDVTRGHRLLISLPMRI